MGLSSNILWHQSNKDALCEILKTNKFYYSYARELIPGIDKEVAFPMISLCDIPLSEIGEYLEKYGGYSIGVSREWGTKNGFNPVWYCEKESRIATILSQNFVDEIINKKKGNAKLIDLHVFSYVKYVEGKLIEHNYENYRFYDEREFRTVYSFSDLLKAKVPPTLNGKDAIDKYKDEHGGKKFVYIGDSIPAKSFTWGDIKYIIVKKDSEVTEIKDLLKKLNCTNRNITVFSHDQIKHDLLGISHSVKMNETSEPTSGDTKDIIVKFQ